MAKAIVDYRQLHGDIKSLQDLRFSKDFTADVIQRLEPYVEY
jgi:DNA uptake protein ComE-like DNA-binding protein